MKKIILIIIVILTQVNFIYACDAGGEHMTTEATGMATGMMNFGGMMGGNMMGYGTGLIGIIFWISLWILFIGGFIYILLKLKEISELLKRKNDKKNK